MSRRAGTGRQAGTCRQRQQCQPGSSATAATTATARIEDSSTHIQHTLHPQVHRLHSPVPLLPYLFVVGVEAVLRVLQGAGQPWGVALELPVRKSRAGTGAGIRISINVAGAASALPEGACRPCLVHLAVWAGLGWSLQKRHTEAIRPAGRQAKRQAGNHKAETHPPAVVSGSKPTVCK